MIKAAQEKESLQREGDDLGAKIKKAEKEIRALENTLRRTLHAKQVPEDEGGRGRGGMERD